MPATRGMNCHPPPAQHGLNPWEHWRLSLAKIREQNIGVVAWSVDTSGCVFCGRHWPAVRLGGKAVKLNHPC